MTKRPVNGFSDLNGGFPQLLQSYHQPFAAQNVTSCREMKPMPVPGQTPVRPTEESFLSAGETQTVGSHKNTGGPGTSSLFRPPFPPAG
ncbi:hypothetical protein ILYODFUR_009508 [Ilyodon furcidens]|uniref:Uncharacterized protein n=1 Tax=Ilyodon furcidens TaxID=33524 RepID=A0ABV0U7W0_9TELE